MATKEKKVITPSKPAATVAKAQGKDPKAVKKAEPAKAAAPKKAEPAKAAAPKKAAPTPSKPAATIKKAEEKSTKKADGSDGNKKIYHVSKREKDGREWKVFIQGSDKVIRICSTQAEALKIAQEFAKNDGNATVMLHGLDGKIRKA